MPNAYVSLFTPFNRSARPPALPSSVSYCQSLVYGKAQRVLNNWLNFPVERLALGLVEADLIHVLEPDIVMSLKPTVITVHDLNWLKADSSYRKIFPRYRQCRAEKAIKLADHLIAVSRSTADDLIAHGVSSARISVVYPACSSELGLSSSALETNRYSALEHQIISALPDSFFVYVGSSHPHKNTEVIARAYASVKAKQLPPTVFVGPSPKGELMNSSISEGSPIIHLGYVSDSLLLYLIRHSIALLFPSLAEGFGLPLLEAMTQSKPIIASSIPVFREVGDEACLYFSPFADDSAVQLAQCMATLAEDESLQTQLANNAYCRSKAFSWSESCARLRDVYSNVLRELG